MSRKVTAKARECRNVCLNCNAGRKHIVIEVGKEERRFGQYGGKYAWDSRTPAEMVVCTRCHSVSVTRFFYFLPTKKKSKSKPRKKAIAVHKPKFTEYDHFDVERG